MIASLRPAPAILACAFSSLLPPPLAAEETATLEAVTVTGKSDADEERQASVNQKTVIDRAEIEAMGGLTVGEVVRKLPGIEADARTGDGGPSASARGMGRDAVQFLVDGERPSANTRYALTTVGRLPSTDLERVEILRGASAEFGSAPITVNLVMKKPKSQASTALKIAAGVRGDEPNGQFTFSQGGGDGSFSWLLPVTINHHGMALEKSLDRQQSTAATRNLWQLEQDSGPYALNEFILTPRLSWRGSDGNLSLWPSLYHNRGDRRTDFTGAAYADPLNGRGLAPAGWRTDNEDSELTIARLRADGDMRTSLGKLSGRIALMDARRQQDTARRGVDASGAPGFGNERIDRNEQEYSSSIRLDRTVGAGLFSTAIEQNWQRREETQRATGSSVYGGDYSAQAQQWVAWLQHEWQATGALLMTAGLRGEYVTLDADGDRYRTGQIAPSVAGRYALTPDLTLRSSLGAGLKAPKLDELSGLTVRSTTFNSPLEPDRGGNPALAAERSLNWELALDWQLAQGAGTFGANTYLRRTEDFIERRPLLEGSRWVERPYNEGTALHWGLELDTKLRGDAFGWSGASIRSHLTLPKGRVDDELLGIKRDVRDLPDYQWSLALDQTLPWWQASAGFQLNLYGRTTTDIPGELGGTQKSRALLDLFATRRLTPQLNLRLDAQNVLGTDLQRQTAAWSGLDSWRLEALERGQRTFMLSLEGKW